MKRRLYHSICWSLGWLFCFFGLSFSGQAQLGIPFFQNYSAEEYDAHNRNFDVVCDANGVVYFANFAGVVYYNGHSWHKLMTPDISRITRLYVDPQDRVWVGGYNFIGRITASPDGTPALLPYISDLRTNRKVTRIGEVLQIEGQEDSISFYTATHRVVVRRDTLTDIIRQEWVENRLLEHDNVKLDDGMDILIDATQGLAFYRDGHFQYRLGEENGLCSNTIHAIASDQTGRVWGATDNGIFALNVPSFFTRYTDKEGLKGEITSILRYQKQLYVGTLHGLFRFSPVRNAFEPIPEIRQACWQLKEVDGWLYAVSSSGLFRFNGGKGQQLSSRNLFSMESDGAGGFYLGAIDGLYHWQGAHERRIALVERIMKLVWSQERLWAETLYGEIYSLTPEQEEPHLMDATCGLAHNRGNKLYFDASSSRLCVLTLQGLMAWEAERQAFVERNEVLAALMERGTWWPGLAVSSPQQRTWMTSGDGKELLIFHKGKLDPQLNAKIHMLHNYSLRALYVEKNGVAWAGGNFGLIRIGLDQRDNAFLHTPEVHIREIRLRHDSLYYGGYRDDIGQEIVRLDQAVSFDSQQRNFKFVFSTMADDVIEYPQYAFYLEGYEDQWNPWQSNQEKEYTNLLYGSYVFHVKAKDGFGRESAVKHFAFVIRKPLYLEWYSLVGYVLLLVALIALFNKWRTYKLLQETMRLEKIVQKRTRQIRIQRDEITEKSQKLEQALVELNEAQEQLIRQEKAATMGKLTQGLIDRILNPMNYIINFSHLSNSLLKDMKEDMEEEAERISEDTYEDMAEILEMMQTHLSKIEEHGHNTSRILKAMEELLTDHSCHFVPTVMNRFCRGILDQAQETYRPQLEANAIRIEWEPLADEVEADVDPLLLGRTILSMLQNSIYAIGKKKEKQTFEGLVRLSLRLQEEQLCIHIYDNGNGIDTHVRDKLFDPFFTTKTSSEAAGVGLYLCREILLNHHGRIEVQSEKEHYTEFILTIPLHQPLTQSDNGRAE
ncbi:MAG: ATP-binding protein [Parabacteroides sp.]